MGQPPRLCYDQRDPSPPPYLVPLWVKFLKLCGASNYLSSLELELARGAATNAEVAVWVIAPRLFTK